MWYERSHYDSLVPTAVWERLGAAGFPGVRGGGAVGAIEAEALDAARAEDSALQVSLSVSRETFDNDVLSQLEVQAVDEAMLDEAIVEATVNGAAAADDVEDEMVRAVMRDTAAEAGGGGESDLERAIRESQQQVREQEERGGGRGLEEKARKRLEERARPFRARALIPSFHTRAAPGGGAHRPVRRRRRDGPQPGGGDGADDDGAVALGRGRGGRGRRGGHAAGSSQRVPFGNLKFTISSLTIT